MFPGLLVQGLYILQRVFQQFLHGMRQGYRQKYAPVLRFGNVLQFLKMLRNLQVLHNHMP